MADMTRRRPSGSTQAESRKRKLNDASEEGESDNNGSTDFPCPFCSAVFVTQLSYNRHVLTFHDGQSPEVFKTEKFEPEEDFEESENAYYENEGEYYYDQSEEVNDDVDIASLLQTTVHDNGQNGNSSFYASNGSTKSPKSNSRNTNARNSAKPQLSPKDLASVLAQVEEMTSATVSDFVTCPLCRKTFGRKELPIHVSCEHGGAKFTCPYCQRTISRRDHLKRHIKNVHPDKCTETEIGPFPRNLNLSRATNNGSPSKQSQNVQGLPVPLQLTLQQRAEEKSNQNSRKSLPITIMAPRAPVKDEEDDEEDDFEGEEQIYNDVQENDQAGDNSMGMQEDFQEEDDSMQITVEPDLPFQDFNDFNDELYHTPSFLLDTLDQYQQKLSTHASTANYNQNSITTSVSMAYQCSLCNAVFSSKTLLDRHESTHSELRPHKCSICGKGFLRKEHLSKHLSSVHSGMKFTCEFCKKDISRKDHLIRHIRNVHPTQFYSLSQDGDQDMFFQPQSQLQQQQLQLQIQTAAYKTAKSLEPKPKKPFFNCDMCEATFINVDDLHAHQATIHSDVRKYKCNYCCKAFKRKEHLTKHEVLHTGERRFTCRVCGNEFQRKDALQDHIKRTHGADAAINRGIAASSSNNAHLISTIPCNLCDQLFQDRGSLLSHMTSVHGLIVNSPPGLPKNPQRMGTNPSNQNQSQNKQIQPQSKPAMASGKNQPSSKNLPSINGRNLGSLMDLINKGSITLSYHPIKSEQV